MHRKIVLTFFSSLLLSSVFFEPQLMDQVKTLQIRANEDVYTDTAAIYSGLAKLSPNLISSDVGSSPLYGGNDATERRVISAAERIWVFWANSSHIVYSTSTDGNIWTSPKQIRRKNSGNYAFSVCLDYKLGNPYVHYAYTNMTGSFTISPCGSIYYRQGLLNSDGTITWNTPSEQTAVAGKAFWTYYGVDIAVDSGHLPYIAYNDDDNADPSTTNDACVTRSEYANGTWSTDTAHGFPYKSSTKQSCVRPRILPLNDNRMYLLYINNTEGASAVSMMGRLWDGTSWGSQSVIVNDCYSRECYAGTSLGDEVYAVYVNWTKYYIKYVKYAYGYGWSSPEVAYNYSAANHWLALCAQTVTGNLFCFWSNQTSGCLMCNKRTSSWGSAFVLYGGEEVAQSDISCSYQNYTNEVHVVFRTNAGLKYYSIEMYRFGDTTVSQALGYPLQRKTFYANGRHWIFYSNGTYIFYKTSVDGVTWVLGESNPVIAGTGRDFSIWFDETYLHYASTTSTAGIGFFYRRGIPNANGTITWSAAEQIAVFGVSGISLSLPFVAVDTGNHPWVAYKFQNGSDYYPYVTKSSNNNGTWSTDNNFPFKLSNNGSLGWISTITPLTNDKMYAISLSAVYNYRIGRLWNGIAWENEESPITASSINCATHSVVAQGDDICLAFLDTPNFNIKYRKRFYSNSSWGTEVTIRANTTYTCDPILSIDTLTNNLYCFWMGSPSINCIYYKKCIGGTWDVNPTTWINATSSGGLTANDAFSGDYKQGQRQNCSFIGLAYLVGSSSPYNITFAYLSPHNAGNTYLGDLGGGMPPQFFEYDGIVDGIDLALFLRCYKGQAPPEAMYLGDLGGGTPPQFFKFDGKVDSKDVALFIRCYKGLGPKP